MEHTDFEKIVQTPLDPENWTVEVAEQRQASFQNNTSVAQEQAAAKAGMNLDIQKNWRCEIK